MSGLSMFLFAHHGLDFVALVTLQVAVVCGMAWLLARRRSAVVRSKVWASAIVACLCGPVLIGTFEFANTSLVSLSSPLPAISVARADDVVAETAPMTVPTTPPPAAAPVLSTKDTAFVALVVAWLIGVGIGLYRLGRSLAVVARLRRSALAIDTQHHAVLLDSVQRAFPGQCLPAMAQSRHVSQAITLGGRGRPVVVIPTQLLESLPHRALRDILVHECAHVIQCDLGLGWLQSAAGVLYWPHPSVHFANRELSIAREELCDNRVLAQGEPTEYARTLLELSEKPHAAIGSMSRGLLPPRWPLEHRIAGLLDGTRSLRTRMGFIGKATVLTVLVSIAGCIAGTRFEHGENAAGAVDGDTIAKLEPAAALAHIIRLLEAGMAEEFVDIYCAPSDVAQMIKDGRTKEMLVAQFKSKSVNNMIEMLRAVSNQPPTVYANGELASWAVAASSGAVGLKRIDGRWYIRGGGRAVPR